MVQTTTLLKTVNKYKIPGNRVTRYDKLAQLSWSCWVLDQEVEISKENNRSHTQTSTELL